MFLRPQKIRDSVFCSSEEEEAIPWVNMVRRVNGGCETSAVLEGRKLLRREEEWRGLAQRGTAHRLELCVVFGTLWCTKCLWPRSAKNKIGDQGTRMLRAWMSSQRNWTSLCWHSSSISSFWIERWCSHSDDSGRLIWYHCKEWGSRLPWQSSG